MQFADVKNDVAFRKIFGNENRKESLISFLNAVLDLEGARRIAKVSILNPYQLPKLRGGKVTVVDVKAVDQAGRNYIVEMQVAELEGFGKRVLYYFSKSYSEQIKRGDLYRELKPVIFIGILDFYYTENPHYLSRSQVRDVETNERTVEDVEFNFIELPKFNKAMAELDNLTEKWVYFIKNAENLDVIPDNVDDEGLRSAYQEANKQTWTREELDAYDYVYMREEDARARFDAAMKKAEKIGQQKGVEIGLKKGDKMGLKKGEKIGEKKGEQKTQVAVAKNAIKKGFDDPTIAELTGLSLELIAQLRQELGA
jgi:predicted transposase/invertase (TIGR01784 family)